MALQLRRGLNLHISLRIVASRRAAISIDDRAVWDRVDGGGKSGCVRIRLCVSLPDGKPAAKELPADADPPDASAENADGNRSEVGRIESL